MHSPEFEFDDAFSSLDTVSLQLRKVGLANLAHTTGYIDIETETPTIGSQSSGFYKKTISTDSNALTTFTDGNGNKEFNKNNQMAARRLCAGMFYKDYFVDDQSDDSWGSVNTVLDNTIYDEDYYWMVYPWHRNGSLNNDCVRPAGVGTRSAELKRKIISNLLFTTTSYSDDYADEGISKLGLSGSDPIKLFHQEDGQMLKINEQNYYADVDMLLIPPVPYGFVANRKGFDGTVSVYSINGYYY